MISNYEREVFESKEPVLVDFWGPQRWPCLALMPVAVRLEKDYADKLEISKVNTAENRMLLAKLRVIGLPSFILYKGGIEINRLSGQHITEGDLIKAIDALIA
jgi:thioredoxin 1